jgi:ankyrin repeat protein
VNVIEEDWMKWILGVFLVVAASLPLAAQQLPPPATSTVDYDNDVKPLLEQNCYSCHGETVQQSGLRLDLRQNALRGGDYGPVIIPGKSAESKLIKRLVDGDGGLQMPPSGPLTDDEIGILRAWIDQGAEFRTAIVERAPAPVDPKVAAFVTAVRSQPRSVIEQLVVADREIVKARDQANSTPLHHAAGFGTIETMALLLDLGAEPNAKNRRGATPLHWAAHDEAKVRLLVSRGAQVNPRQVEGRTPLFLAASMGTGHPIVRFLLENGGDPSLATANGQTPLMAAAIRGDVQTMRGLIEKKIDVNAKNGAGETALVLAAANGSSEAVKLLLANGADARVRSKRGETALGDAALAGVEETVKLLLDHGAEVNVRNIRGFSPLMLAASSETIPAGVVTLLQAKGADASFTADYDETARDLAVKRGDTEVARLLGVTTRRAAAVSLATSRDRSTSQNITTAVEKALAMVEKQSPTFVRTAGCNSCHSQDLPSAAAALARSRGLAAPKEIAQLPPSMTPPAERIMDFSVVAISGIAWELFDLGMNNVPNNAYTDAATRYLLAMQTADGNWPTNESRRPPMAAGNYQAAALAIYGLKRYTPTVQQAISDAAVSKAVAWLERAQPTTTQDRAFQTMGLVWAHAGSESINRAMRNLLALQRNDGGWSQLPTLESDAYATGQALYALNLAGRMTVGDSAFRKGVDYLLSTQAADGSWHVKSRAVWLQPYFESGFPYGQDQFISTAGTAWAAMALTVSTEAQATTVQR